MVAATGSLNGLPILNGPINPVGTVYGMKKRVGDFIHPGLWHTHDDLERIRLGVLNKQDPWKTAFVNFSTDSFSQASVSSYPFICCQSEIDIFLVRDARAKKCPLSRTMQQLHNLLK